MLFFAYTSPEHFADAASRIAVWFQVRRVLGKAPKSRKPEEDSGPQTLNTQHVALMDANKATHFMLMTQDPMMASLLRWGALARK